MPFIPQNEYNPSAPIEGCTNAENDRRDSEATKMISSMELFNECAKYDAQEDIFFGSEENRFWAEREVGFDATEATKAHGVAIHQRSEGTICDILCAALGWDNKISAKPVPSPASLMLADLAIDYSQDDATVAMLDEILDKQRAKDAKWYANHFGEGPTPSDIAWIDLERSRAHRAWADQFAKDIVAAGEARAKRASLPAAKR
jgi:hypothetical protein